MLLLANLFPFIYMKVGGISSEIELLEIPNVLFSEDYASLGTFFYFSSSWCRLSPGHHTAAGQSGEHAFRAKGVSGADPVSP